ncbi:unnamed protein product [Leuciscus chuanchicus]
MVVDFRRTSRRHHLPLTISGSEVDIVHSVKFLGVHLTNELTSSDNTTAIIKRAQQRLHSLRRLKKVDLPISALTMFYRGTIESILTYCISCWFGNSTAEERHKLNRIVRTAEKIIGASLSRIQDIYTERCVHRANSIIKDFTHFSRDMFILLQSDAVDAPVLTVNSNWSSSDSCTVNFTCRAHDLMINSSYQNNRCSPEEVTSQINTLILNCSEESIICNHSNPVSWKIDRINITQLCGENDTRTIHTLTFDYILISTVIVVGVIVFSGLVLYCFCKNNKGVKQSDDTDYDDVESLMQKMTGDTWTTITYRTVGHQTPSSAHEC